jgi:heme-degrading monooxygenase HmoA
MAILVTALQSGGSPEEAERFKTLLHDKLQKAPGFLFHADGPVEGGWQIVDAWETREDFDRWYESEVKPNLREGQTGDGPPNIVELANVVTR